MRIKLNDIITIEEYNKRFNVSNPAPNRTIESILDSIDFAEIEKYVRNKKLKNINGNNNIK